MSNKNIIDFKKNKLVSWFCCSILILISLFTLSGCSSSPTNFKVDWKAAAKETKEEILRTDPLVQDITFLVDDKKKEVTIAIIVNAAIEPRVTLDIADTAIRRFGSNAQIYGYNVEKTPSKDYYGPLYDEYGIYIGVANIITHNDEDKWYINQFILPSMHTQTKLKLQKMYVK